MRLRTWRCRGMGPDAAQRLGGRRARGLSHLSVQGWPGRSRSARAPLRSRPVRRSGSGRRGQAAMHAPATHQGIAAFMLEQTRLELDTLAVENDIPLHTMA